MVESIDISGKKILVTDDNPVNRTLLKELLESSGYHIIESDSGEDCIKKAGCEAPDLILLDIMMPVMSGIEVCKILKQNSATRQIPVIFVTANTENSPLNDAFEAGGTDYVRKPVNKVELRARVKSVLLQQVFNERLIEDEKLKSVLEMTGGICHELNQPLQYIASATQLIGMSLPEDEKLQIQIEKVLQQVERMGMITKKLMGITSVKTCDYINGIKIIDINKSSY